MNELQQEFLDRAFATLNGSARQRKLALAYARADSLKKAARLCSVTLATAKLEMTRLYAAHDVGGLTHLLVIACHRLDSRRASGAIPDSPTFTEDVGRESRHERAASKR